MGKEPKHRLIKSTCTRNKKKFQISVFYCKLIFTKVFYLLLPRPICRMVSKNMVYRSLSLSLTHFLLRAVFLFFYTDGILHKSIFISSFLLVLVDEKQQYLRFLFSNDFQTN